MTAICGGSPAYLGERDLDVMDWLRNGLFAAAGAVLIALVQAWRKPSSRAELLEQEWRIASATIERLDGQVTRLADRVCGLESQNAACLDENNHLKNRLSSLEHILQRLGIPVSAEDLPGSFVVMEGDRRTVLKPTTKKNEE